MIICTVLCLMSIENVIKATSFILYFCENKYFIIGENKLEAKHGLDIMSLIVSIFDLFEN